MGDHEILDSWKEISDYLKRDTRTCQRYEAELGLPVHRLDESARARVFAYTDEIDAWRNKKGLKRPGAISRLFSTVKSKPFAAALAVFLVLGLAALVGLLVWDRPGDSGRRPGLSIAVLPVQSGPETEGDRDWIRRLTPLLINGLSGSTYFEVLSYDRVIGAFKDLKVDPAADRSEDDLREIARITGATHIITPVGFKAGDGRLVALTVRRPGSGEAYTSRHEIAGEAGVLQSVGLMVDQIKKDLGLTRTNQAGDYDFLGIAITTSSFEAFTLYNQARRLHVKQDFAQSAHVIRRALAVDPNFALAWRSLAVSLVGERKHEEAQGCIDKALEFSRNASIQEQFLIKTTYFQMRSEFGRAIETSREWTSQFPDDTDALLWNGRGCLLTEDAEGARRALDECLRKGNRNPYLFYYAALAYMAAGRFEEADQVTERGLSVHPKSPLVAGEGLLNALAQGQLDRALRELESLRALGSGLPIELRLGDVLLLKGDLRGAEDQYTAVRPFSPHTTVRLARLALAKGNYGRAAELAAAARDHTLLAYIDGRLGRPVEGLKAAAAALEVPTERGSAIRGLTGPLQLESLLLKGSLEVLAGDLEAAKATAARLRGSRPNGYAKAKERSMRCLDGLIAGASGYPEQAAKEFESAIALLSLDVPYVDEDDLSIGIMAEMQALTFYWAARQYESMGNLPVAEAHYKRLLGLNGGRLQHPDLFALSHYAVGRILEAQGDNEQARKSYVQFLELWKDADPGLPEVEDAKARLAAL